MVDNLFDNKKVYRCDAISEVDGFLSVRDVLKLEMFGEDDGLRNFYGVLSDLERLFPDFNTNEALENFDINKLEYDDEYRYEFVDEVIRMLQHKCSVPKSCFNYGIWACDTPEEVAESYDVDIDDVNCYELNNAVLLQDLGPEGQLYGVPNKPECVFEESTKKFVESVNSSKEEIFEWLPFLNSNYKPLDALLDDNLEIAFDSDYKNEIISKSENQKVWKSARLRNEAYIVEKAMDDFESLISGLNFEDHYDESIKLIKERAPSKKYLNYLFLKTIGNVTISLAHKHLRLLDGEILRKFISTDVSSKDALVGRTILFCYLSFILGKELFSSFLGLYTLQGAKTDKGELFNRKSRTLLNDVLDQFREVTFDENKEFIPVKNGNPEPNKLSPFTLVYISSFALINNKIGSLGRKATSTQKKIDKEEAKLANTIDNPLSGIDEIELVDKRFEYKKLGETIYKVLASKTKKITDNYKEALRQYKDTGTFAPEMSAFIFYAILNPRGSVIDMVSRSFDLEKFAINDVQKFVNFGFDNSELRTSFIKFMKLNDLAFYDEEMFKFQENLLNMLERLSGKQLDKEPMKFNPGAGDWQSYLLGNHYIVSNRVIGAKSRPDSSYDKGEREIIMENKEEFFNRIYEECVCASGASGISDMTPQHMMACVDQKVGDVSRFTGGNGGKKLQSEKDVLFQNDTMKVHKKKGKKGDAITGTGVVYANGKFMEALKEALDNFDWDKMELSDDYKNSKLNETKRDSNNKIESNHEGSVGDWTDQDSLVFAYDLLDSGKGDLDERAILKELHKTPYFNDLFDEIEKAEEREGGSTANTVGWDNVASDEIEHAAEEVHKILQDLKNK